MLGAVIQEAKVLFPDFFVAGPLIEEALKPSGVYLLLVKHPYLLHSQLFTAGLSALGGLAFGLIESLVYVTVYVDDPSPAYTVFRFTVPVGLHVIASFIFGLGIDRRLIIWARGEMPLKATGWRFFVAAIALHSLYNITATVVEVVRS